MANSTALVTRASALLHGHEHARVYEATSTQLQPGNGDTGGLPRNGEETAMKIRHPYKFLVPDSRANAERRCLRKRRSTMGWSLALCNGALIAFCAAAHAAPCESLAGLALPYTTISVAQSVTAGTFTLPGSPPIANLPAFCRVAGIIKPTSDSNIKFEVWMPSSSWNGKYLQVGNGAFGGQFSYVATGGSPGIADGLRRGYATAGTDDGHMSNSLFDATFALGHPEQVIDFGYRAVHETAEKSKAVVEAFYGEHPHYAYFNGCSSGGREALIEAQRFPDDFEGIIAGAPANFWTHLMAGTVWKEQATLGDPGSYIPYTKLPAITAAAVAACDALDGIADAVIDDPRKCQFDPSPLLCTGAESNSCLTEPQLTALEKIYAGARNPRTGQQIFPGYMPGTEAFNLGLGSWSRWITGTTPGTGLQYTIGNQFFANMVFDDPNWAFRTFDFDTDMASTDTKLASILNAIDPDLSSIAARGGRIIMYHGWNDPAIAPVNSVNYYESAVRAVAENPGNRFGDIAHGHAWRKTQEFFRLFMVPGMNHCAGGPAPSIFDMLTALENWVENGVAPDRVIASHVTNGVVDRTRPLCRYPQVAVFQGAGSTDDAANFACAFPEDDDDGD